MGIDTELQANLNKAKSGRMMFAFAHKGSAGSLLVDRKVSSKDAAEAKKKAGGGTLFRGRCFGEEGELIFEVAKEPPSALQAAIKRTINLEAGLSLKVVVRFAADAEAEENGQESETEVETNGTVPKAPPQQTAPIPPAPPPPGSDAAFKNRLKAVQAQLAAAGGPTPDQQMLLNQAFSAARNKDYAAAVETLKEIDGTKKPKKEEPDTLESTTFKRALADLKPRFDKARVIDSALMPQMGQILSLAKANRYADALEMLDKLEIDVDRVLASASKPANTGDKFKARLKALLPQYNAAIKEDPELSAKLRPLMGQVIALSNSNQFDQASVSLIQIEKALNVAKPSDVADAVRNRFAGLKDAIKAALVAGGPNVAQIQTLVSAFGNLLKNKDTAQADKILDELEPLLKQVAGGGTGDLAAEWKAKLAEWSPAIKKALADKGPNAAAISKLLAQANASSKPGADMAEALAKLTECYKLAGGTPPGTSPDGQPETKPTSAKVKLVQYRKCLLRWEKARKDAGKALEELQKAMAEEFPDVASEVGVVKNVLAEFNGDLEKKIDAAMIEEDEKKRVKFEEEALDIVRRYTKYVLSDRRMQAIDDDNPFKTSKVGEPLLGALSDLEGYLSA